MIIVISSSIFVIIVITIVIIVITIVIIIFIVILLLVLYYIIYTHIDIDEQFFLYLIDYDPHVVFPNRSFLHKKKKRRRWSGSCGNRSWPSRSGCPSWLKGRAPGHGEVPRGSHGESPGWRRICHDLMAKIAAYQGDVFYWWFYGI